MSTLPARHHAAVAALVGLTVGGLAGTWFGSSLAADSSPTAVNATADTKDDARERAPESVALEAPATSSMRTATASAAEPSAPVDAACPIYGAVQRAHGERGIREGWKGVRADDVGAEELIAGLAEYEKLVLETPISIGRKLGEARNATDAALEDAKRGGLFALLKSLEEKNAGPIVDVVRDAKQMDAYFQRSSTGASFVDGPSHRKHADDALENGATLTFPAGVFRVGNLLGETRPTPRDVTVRGAGMDATLLVTADELFRAGLVNLTLRDCTLHTDGNYLTDIRSQPASMTFERVRFIGFDSGAGGSCLLAAKALAVRAFDCQFIGGYGRSPRSGQLFDVRTNSLIARFDRCLFDQLGLELRGIRPRATVVMIGCTLTDMFDDQPYASNAHAGLALDGCTVGYLEGGSRAAATKDLNALFPDWKDRMER